MLWKQYMITRNVEFLRKYKRLSNQIRKITRSIQRAEQNEVAKSAKTNPKKIWAYVKNKSSLKTTIGDVKTRVDEKEVILSNDEDKASAFCNYFSSVFTVNDSTASNVDDLDNVIIETDLETSWSEIEFNDQCIFKALDKLTVKSRIQYARFLPKIEVRKPWCV